MLLEVAVEGERLLDAAVAHDLEARAVDEAEMAAVGLEPCRHGRVMQLRVQPVEVQERDDLAFEGAHGLHAHAPLDQGKGLDQDVVRGEKGDTLGKQAVPDRRGFPMPKVGRTEPGKKCRGVDENG